MTNPALGTGTREPGTGTTRNLEANLKNPEPGLNTKVPGIGGTRNLTQHT